MNSPFWKWELPFWPQHCLPEIDRWWTRCWKWEPFRSYNSGWQRSIGELTVENEKKGLEFLATALPTDRSIADELAVENETCLTGHSTACWLRSCSHCLTRRWTVESFRTNSRCRCKIYTTYRIVMKKLPMSLAATCDRETWWINNGWRTRWLISISGHFGWIIFCRCHYKIPCHRS